MIQLCDNYRQLTKNLLECRTHVQLANEHVNTHVFMNGSPTKFMNPGIVSYESSVLATIH